MNSKLKQKKKLSSAFTEPCKYWREGRCLKGNSCTYLHVGKVEQTYAVCKKWKRTGLRCKKTCKYLHYDPQPHPKSLHCPVAPPSEDIVSHQKVIERAISAKSRLRDFEAEFQIVEGFYDNWNEEYDPPLSPEEMKTHMIKGDWELDEGKFDGTWNNARFGVTYGSIRIVYVPATRVLITIEGNEREWTDKDHRDYRNGKALHRENKMCLLSKQRKDAWSRRKTFGPEIAKSVFSRRSTPSVDRASAPAPIVCDALSDSGSEMDSVSHQKLLDEYKKLRRENRKLRILLRQKQY